MCRVLLIALMTTAATAAPNNVRRISFAPYVANRDNSIIGGRVGLCESHSASCQSSPSPHPPEVSAPLHPSAPSLPVGGGGVAPCFLGFAAMSAASLTDKLLFLRKVLKLCRHLLDHGSPQFTLALRRNAACLQQFSVYAGPPDALYGNAHYRNVRTAAADLAGALYADDPDSPPKPRDRPPPSTGMGCVSDGRTPRASMQGFGFTAPGAGEGLLDRIQRVASVVLATATPTPSQQPIRNAGSGLHRDGYQPMAAEEVSVTTSVARPAERAARDTRIAVHRPGQAGGGWDESDSSDSLSQASVGAGVRLSGPASLSGSHRSGSDGRSLDPDVTATLPPGRQEGAGGDEEDEEEEEEREEQQLVARVVGGSRPFLSPAENQALLREAGLLNCELLAVRLSERLGDPSDTVKMRAMAALSSLVNSDLLSHEQVWGAAASALHTVSGGPPGACADRANKVSPTPHTHHTHTHHDTHTSHTPHTHTTHTPHTPHTHHPHTSSHTHTTHTTTHTTHTHHTHITHHHTHTHTPHTTHTPYVTHTTHTHHTHHATHHTHTTHTQHTPHTSHTHQTTHTTHHTHHKTNIPRKPLTDCRGKCCLRVGPMKTGMAHEGMDGWHCTRPPLSPQC
ncbi:AP-4 complex accessory subunit tepsin isoform X3 [Lampetra planeri]